MYAREKSQKKGNHMLSKIDLIVCQTQLFPTTNRSFRCKSKQNKPDRQKQPVILGKWEVYVKTVILIIFFKYYELFIPYSEKKRKEAPTPINMLSSCVVLIPGNCDDCASDCKFIKLYYY